MARKIPTRLPALLCCLVLVAASCSDAGNDIEVTGTARPDSSEPDPTLTSTSPPGDGANAASSDCPSQHFSGSVSRVGSEDVGHVDVELTDGQLVDAAAFSLGRGFQYTVYVASFEIADDDFGSTLVAPPGEVLVTFAARGLDGNEIELGVVYDETFVIVDSGGGAQNFPVDPVGTVEFISLTEDHLCVIIQFTDENQTLNGTVSARIAGGF